MLDTVTNISPSYQDKHPLPKSNTPSTTAVGLRNTPALLLRTLNRTRLNAQAFADLTGRISRYVRFPLAPAERGFEMRYFQSGCKRIPFPPDSHGFLYWHVELDALPVSGQVRFRTTRSSDPATFPSGRDLQLPDGLTWSISLLRIARQTQYSGLRAHLLYEELVTEKVLATVANTSPSLHDNQRIPKSDIHAISTAKVTRHSALRLCTLNQARLDADDFVDLTGQRIKDVRFPLASEAPRLQIYYFRSASRNYIPFPRDSQGFFYWHLDRDAPPVSGQVRFRTTTSSDPATFPSGRDLQLPNSRTWHISLFDIARRSQYSGLRAYLLSEKLITKNVLNTALNISVRQGAGIVHPATGSILIWKFGQRFLVDLPSFYVSVWIVGSSAGERLLLPSLFPIWVRESESTGMCYVLSGGQRSDWRISPETGDVDDLLKGVDYTPLTGQALVQFERSTLPEHHGTRTVVLRILKVMKKSESSDDESWMPEQEEDGLDMTGIHQHAWSLNVDQPPRRASLGSSWRALRILFDNEALHQRSGSSPLES
ncbi:hypothetical protein OE88DRAFT_1222195 [Heliocybe sulcata]|uniref:Uncharacterized protein n=1 Tax=Heliocybe sulcata TaxID=5364 RepID=A0A5C3MKZ5_9AGAM|nr:hypothetical protein OE88DRAFT_1222195 [Heliocybe sulcata]